MTTLILTALAGAVLAPQIQIEDAARAYIDAGFAMLDANKDGRVDPAEFETFMRARLARQAVKFDAAFAEIDANHDGRITKAEATTIPGLAQNFAEVDLNGNGSIDKGELRTAAADAQMQAAGLSD